MEGQAPSPPETWDALFSDFYLRAFANDEADADAGANAQSAARLAACPAGGDLLDVPCEPWPEGGDERPGLIVAYDLDRIGSADVLQDNLGDRLRLFPYWDKIQAECYKKATATDLPGKSENR